MTREEAISYLNMIDFINGECILATWWRGIDDEMRSAIEMAIEALEQEPSVTPKQSWIPVSERLPDTNDDVLVTDGTNMFVAWNFGEHDEWGSFNANFDRYTEVVAWMPLPEPYKAGRSGEE